MAINKTLEWERLESHFEQDLKSLDIADLVEKGAVLNLETGSGAEEKSRFDSLSLNFERLFVDFSKQKMNLKTFELLNSLAEAAGLKSAIQDLAKGEKVNSTEDRPALHSALRLQPDDSLELDGLDINLAVQKQLTLMSNMIDELTLGHWRGYSGKPIKDIVNLGVGGSDLGPLLVCHALDEFKAIYKNPISIHFASTMDGSQVSSLFEMLNPETTAFIIVSKSFSTIDTLSNAASAKAWLLNHCDNEDVINKQHFIGISTTECKMSAWGIHIDHQLKLWNWVGGRFSLWSTVGLSIAIKIGMRKFRELLKGANALDNHFFTTEFERNIPVLLGLVGVWNTNFLNINAHAVLPYDARLKYFPDYLTQLEMESNGKSVTQAGEKVEYATCPVLWGEVGPNAQHAFYQLLHQGTRQVACDFIAPIKRLPNSKSSADNSAETLSHEKSLQEQHLLTLANCFAQSRALMLGGSTDITDGKENARLAIHKLYPGNQPSTTILLDELTPYSLGQLIALYEHKVFVMATIWNINPFDQWGVELGKIMANETLKELHTDSEVNRFDDSTNGLMNLVKK